MSGWIGSWAEGSRYEKKTTMPENTPSAPQALSDSLQKRCTRAYEDLYIRTSRTATWKAGGRYYGRLRGIMVCYYGIHLAKEPIEWPTPAIYKMVLTL